MARLSAAGRSLRDLVDWSATAVRSIFFMSPRDIGLFLRSARTDAALARLRPQVGLGPALDALYAGGDPWASGETRYRYQRRKYEVICRLLPERRFARALDLGSGLGLLASRLALQADEVLGLDISQVAVDQARDRHRDLSNLTFGQADVLDLPSSLDGCFDLVVVADTLYYLPKPLEDGLLDAIAARVVSLLRPGGVCLIANHFFFAADPDSRLSRRIHRAFTRAPDLDVVSEHRRPFYLVSVLQRADARGLAPEGEPVERALPAPLSGVLASLAAG